LWFAGISVTIVFSSLTLGLNRMDKRKAQEQKVQSIRDSAQALIINQIKDDQKTIKNDIKDILKNFK